MPLLTRVQSNTLIVLGLMSALIVTAICPRAGVAARGDRRLDLATDPASNGVTTTFVPFTTRGALPVPKSRFGIESYAYAVQAVMPGAVPLNASFVRYGGLRWAALEPVPGARNWDQLSQIDKDLTTISLYGAQPMVAILHTPLWAQKNPGSDCGPIAPAALDAFATVMHDLVMRYSKPPYNVHYWELGNEPDAPMVADDQGFGCWGDPADAYDGGGYYAEMLKRVYPQIKAADPGAQVVMGGLLLACDPTHHELADDCSMGNFLEGVLRNGGGDAFDLLAYHAYAYYTGKVEDWDRNNPDWAHRGGVTLGKLDFLRSVMSKYGVAKPILMNEGSLICRDTRNQCPSDRFFDDQANYLARLFVRSYAAGLDGVIWYTLNGPGWYNGGLLDSKQQPRPAYTAFSFLSPLLANATFDGSLAIDGGEGYAFHQGSTKYLIYWMNSDVTVQMTPPPTLVATYDLMGRHSNLQAVNVSVGFEPVVLEVQQ